MFFCAIMFIQINIYPYAQADGCLKFYYEKRYRKTRQNNSEGCADAQLEEYHSRNASR